jgi:hypothetical protein
MTDFNQNVDQAKDLLNLEQQDMQKLPQMLNVLTILTYIGCALGALGALYSFFTASTAYKAYEEIGTKGVDTENKTLNTLMSGAMEMAKKQYDNRFMLLIFGVVGIALCFYGAMQMRNLKKQGYLLYVIGELLPIISFAIFIGFGSLLGGISMIFTVLFSALFIILYTTQRKNLVN